MLREAAASAPVFQPFHAEPLSRSNWKMIKLWWYYLHLLVWKRNGYLFLYYLFSSHWSVQMWPGIIEVGNIKNYQRRWQLKSSTGWLRRPARVCPKMSITRRNCFLYAEKLMIVVLGWCYNHVKKISTQYAYIIMQLPQY